MSDWRPQEWDWLLAPRELAVNPGGPLGDRLGTLTAHRGDDLDLKLEMVGEVEREAEGPVGSLIKIEEIPPIAVEWKGFEGRLLGFTQTGRAGDRGKGIATEIEFTREPGDPHWSSYWLVNVENRNWPESTRRESYTETSIVRPGRRTRKATRRHEVNSRDCLIVDAPQIKLAIGTISDGPCPPEWHPGFLEVERGANGKLPEEDSVYGAIELIRFLLGSEIACIGRTDFNGEDCWQRLACHARTIQIGHFKDSPSEEPILPISRSPLENDLAETLARLLPRYLAGRDTDNFYLALYHYALARRLPSGVNVAMFATALDLLVKGYFEHRSEGSIYLPRREFKERTAAVRASLVESLDATAASTAIMLNKFDQLNQRSENDRREHFFTKLDLELGIAERKALGYRNRAVHGAKAPADFVPIYWHGVVFENLVARVVLRLLGYDGLYIDHATPGWPKRKLEQPCGVGLG